MDYKKIANKILILSKKAGADKAEVFIQKTKQTSMSVSELKLEYSNQANTIGYGLTFINKGKKVFVDSSDFSISSIRDVINRAKHLSKYVEEDPYNDIAKRKGRLNDYALFDPLLVKIPLEKKIYYLKQIEKNALKYDKRIKKASWIGYHENIEDRVIANTNGVFGYYKTSNIQLWANVLAESNGEKQEGEYGQKTHFFKKLTDPLDVANKASSMALILIGGTRVPSTNVPVVFDPYASWSLLRFGIFEAVIGLNILQKSSFLAGRLGDKIASELVTIIDDGTMPGGVATAPFDDEGVKTQKNIIVDKGVLKMFLYNIYSANKAKTQPTGNASRDSYKEMPRLKSRNLYLAKGSSTPEQIISKVKNGFWVKNTIGFGVDSVTGSYSIGAAGRWIKNGKLGKPVSGVTIASSLDDLLMGIDAVGNDLEFRFETAAPTFRVSNMTVSGT